MRLDVFKGETAICLFMRFIVLIQWHYTYKSMDHWWFQHRRHDDKILAGLWLQQNNGNTQHKRKRVYLYVTTEMFQLLTKVYRVA